ncbi:MAG: T9SS type A sorting domain-containing protein, partial [Bacteroidales bacterium]|nr:T9SS type A sorting domain-containing protein [Bacteroidales bacterium]
VNFNMKIWDFPALVDNVSLTDKSLKSANAVDIGTFVSCMALAAFNEGASALAKFIALEKEYKTIATFMDCIFNVGGEVLDGAVRIIRRMPPGKKKPMGGPQFLLDCGGNILEYLFETTAGPWLLGVKALFHAINCYDEGTPAKVTFVDVLITAISSKDPNEIVGPPGFGTKNWIQKNKIIPYAILFENKDSATAPAHDVFITDTLDLSVFDISDFGFSSFGWGDTILTPPGNRLKEFSMDIDLRPELELITRVSGKLDTLTGIVRWEFLSLNPGTMYPEESAFLGFLPPNVNSPEGEGFVSFSVGLKEEPGTGDEIRNQATIVFDANQPIITNEYLNTLDLDAPQSQVYPLEATIDSRFPVDWTGSDEGSGIKGYSIYVLVNDTALVPWMINTAETSAIFEGEVGSSYKFYSIATDNVSLVESAPNGYDAQTTVTVDVQAFEQMKENLKVWPNPAKDHLRVTFSHAPCGMYAIELVSATGAVKHSQLYEATELQNGITINIRDCAPGNYVLRIVFGEKSDTKKVVVQ